MNHLLRGWPHLLLVSAVHIGLTQKALAASKPRGRNANGPAQQVSPPAANKGASSSPQAPVERVPQPSVTTYQPAGFLVPVIGLTGASGFGPPRFGPDLSLLSGMCVDACSGWGITGGLLNFEREEYYAGLAMGAAYFGSLWIEVAAHISKRRLTGLHASYAMGWFMMPFLELGADFDRGAPTARIGLTLKAPLGRVGL